MILYKRTIEKIWSCHNGSGSSFGSTAVLSSK